MFLTSALATSAASTLEFMTLIHKFSLTCVPLAYRNRTKGKGLLCY